MASVEKDLSPDEAAALESLTTLIMRGQNPVVVARDIRKRIPGTLDQQKAVVEALVARGLATLNGTYPQDWCGLTLQGLLASSQGILAMNRINTILALLRNKLREEDNVVRFTWRDVKTLANPSLSDEDLGWVVQLIYVAGLQSGGGSLATDEKWYWGLPRDAELVSGAADADELQRLREQASAGDPHPTSADGDGLTKQNGAVIAVANDAIGVKDTVDAELEGYESPVPGGWEDYPLDELAIRDERRTAEDVVRRIKNGRFVLDPDFQRGFVWDEKKQSRLIESILMRIPLPVFYVAEDAQGRLIVVDGRQRLTTLDRFLSGEFKLNLEDRQDLHGRHLKDLDVRLQNRVEDCQLLFYIIDHAVPERARLDIFERVNGGEVLTRQQMRNAIYNGPATVFLREEAATDLFKKVTGKSLDAKKMQDREFVNRFCSFTLLPLDSYKGDMDDWLARGLMLVGKLDESARLGLHQKFQQGLRNNLLVFGKHAFRKHRQPEQSRSIINASLFDVMSTGLSVHDETLVASRAEELRAAFYAAMDNKQFEKAITWGPNTPKEVRARFEIATHMIGQVLDAP